MILPIKVQGSNNLKIFHPMKKTVLGIFAHPDDAEIMVAGTLTLFQKAGWNIHIATMTPGDKGSAEFSREELSLVRREEALKSAALIAGTYHCLECEDIYFMYDRETINKATALIRTVRPDVVITASPADYMGDHEITSQIVQTACFSSGIKNMDIAETCLENVPALFYCDPMEGSDIFGKAVKPAFYVDISGEMDVKEQMLACHESQRNWLKKHHKMDEYIDAMKRFSARRGEEIGVRYAEGFRQHLGHGFPKNNLMQEVLGNFVVTNKD
jgi:LmbE family N-acetylglucosaminyl deacetylase